MLWILPRLYAFILRLKKVKNVLLVDDHSIVRQGLKNLIELEADLNVTGEAASGLEALNLVRANS